MFLMQLMHLMRWRKEMNRFKGSGTAARLPEQNPDAGFWLERAVNNFK